MTREHVRQLWAAGMTLTEISHELGRAKSTIAYHLRGLGVEGDDRFSRRYDWSQVQAFYDSGHSLTECQLRFGFSICSWAEAAKRGDVEPRARAAPLRNYLVSGRRVSRTHLKGRLLKEGLKRSVCERCGLSEWRGRPLSIALHHVNGNGRDNRLENLLFLCPNCHSQTPNYGGRTALFRRRPNDLDAASGNPLD